MKKLTPSQEDYLEAIYLECKKSPGNCAKVTEIAKTLNVKKASVTGALSLLSEKKLVNYAPYSPVTLSESGESAAKEILDRHEVMTSFFKNILNLSEEESAQNACAMEHVMTPEMFRRIQVFADFIKDYSAKTPDFKKEIKGLFS